MNEVEEYIRERLAKVIEQKEAFKIRNADNMGAPEANTLGYLSGLAVMCEHVLDKFFRKEDEEHYQS